MSNIEQIKSIEQNAKNVYCPIILSEMNKRYRELKEQENGNN